VLIFSYFHLSRQFDMTVCAGEHKLCVNMLENWYYAINLTKFLSHCVATSCEGYVLMFWQYDTEAQHLNIRLWLSPTTQRSATSAIVVREHFNSFC